MFYDKETRFFWPMVGTMLDDDNVCQAKIQNNILLNATSKFSGKGTKSNLIDLVLVKLI